jgi:hypothetical protein
MPRRHRRTAKNAIYEFYGDNARPSLDPAENERRRLANAERREHVRKMLAESTTEWTRCIIPGCNFQTTKRLPINVIGESLPFPICTIHAVMAWEMVERNDKDAAIRQARDAMQKRRDEIRLEFRVADQESRTQWKAALKTGTVDGDIYFVRTSGLVKVGWTTDLHRRLRTYGPEAVVLVHYPGTRQDETTLHRQLTPARVKGREWYEDGDIIAGFVAAAVEKYGPPVIKVRWTEHNKGPTPRSWTRHAS